jgi:hypothetical protein
MNHVITANHIDMINLITSSTTGVKQMFCLQKGDKTQITDV